MAKTAKAEEERIKDEGGNNPDQVERADQLSAEPPKESATEVVDDPAAALEAIKKQLEEEKQARQSADARRVAAEQEAARHREAGQTAQTSVVQAQLTAVSRALDAAEATIKGYKAEFSAAAQAQDFDKLAEIQALMSEETAKKVALENGKRQLEELSKRPPPQEEPTGNDFDRAITRFTPRTQEWIRKHPEVMSDTKASNLAQAAHFAALAAGHIQDSDAYFDHVDRTLGYKQDAQPTTRRVSSEAPVSRGTPGSNGRGKELRVQDMTPHMRQLAKEAEMKEEEWIKEYNRLASEDPSFVIH